MLPAPVRAQETFVINLRDADISLLVEQISEITGRTLVLDPGLVGEVTVVSAEALDKEGVWSLFQSILRVRGFVAVQAGSIWQVIPEAEARTASGPNLGEEVIAGSQDFVTEMLRLNRLPSAEAVRVLRPLVAESGYIEAVEDPNGVVITDTRANVDRIMAIARSFDGDALVRSEVLRFRSADAVTVGSAILEVLGQAGTGARLSVDAGSNLLLVRGTPEDIAEIRSLAIAMDVAPRKDPREAVATTVFNLQYGDAQIIADIIKGTVGDATDITNAVAADVGAQSAEATSDGQFVPLNRVVAPDAVNITASVETNSIVVRGTAAQVQEVGQLVHALDVRRPQVMIEAAIVEVSGEVAERLGVQLGLGPNVPNGAIAASNFSNGGGVSLGSVLAAVGVPAGSALSTGLTLGAGGNDFGILVQALSQSTSARLLSTPSVTTLDNEPATIVVGQNVPFRTGSFATDGNTATPFTTIERRDVGITMNVVPRITAGGVVQLVIEQEISSLTNANVEGAADLVTNRRVINTTVMADNRGTVVLGGLITDDRINGSSKVPGLGDLPVVGELFKSRNARNTQRTLFVFLRPTILRSREDITEASSRRFNRLKAADARQQPRTILKKQEVQQLPLEIQGLY
ncbi:MAG: type II secretion system protein GspD [Roseobacter sp.]|uniref:General secretion pathway protein D n=2 Tax=Alphaproteobacteria TaxID=28211 RepID=A0A1H3BM08_9RHOB|nr:type II secretion system secretin GspD [Sulfitobacter pontiacus]MBG64874.1 type II secretion system protein GspD [Roseobacter sp.]SDX42953.1 general secretion pathway protein D [Sulfitobacter pontiacus]